MKKNKIVLGLGFIIVPTLSVVAISCNSENDKINKNEDTSPKFQYDEPKLLDFSQLEEIKNAFLFKLTKEAENLPLNEIIKIVKEIRKKNYPEEHGKFSSNISSNVKFNGCIENEKFKRYFIYKAPEIKTFQFLRGHLIEMELLATSDKNIPAIRYSIRCPDLVVNGKMSVEDTRLIYLDINI